ncbi:Major facilitator super domain-containing protein 7 [Phlyctochytrium bullatum]|nr:Major facilitator super domain-containing protein 7 [Phlyctochytrium bullatum]
MVHSGSLENLQLWVMIIVATKLFLRADEVLNLEINDPEDPGNPDKTENCINWRLSAMVNGEITRLAFNIRGKTEKAGSVPLTIWEETVVNQLDAIRPLLAYIHLAKLKGGFLFPRADELSKLRNGEGGGIGRHPISYNVFLEKLKSACKPHVLDRDSFGTHTLRKTAYALAVFGGASDIEIMNAARHKCTKSASTYKQDAYYMYQLCRETANGLSLETSPDDLDKELSAFAPKWRSIFVLHAQLAAGINRLQAPATRCLKTIADDFIQRRCGVEAGTVFGTVRAVADAATFYRREATKKEILRQKLEEIQKTDSGLASDLQRLFSEVIFEERSEAVALALRQAGVLPTPKTPCATPKNPSAASPDQPENAVTETLVLPEQPVNFSSLFSETLAQKWPAHKKEENRNTIIPFNRLRLHRSPTQQPLFDALTAEEGVAVLIHCLNYKHSVTSPHHPSLVAHLKYSKTSNMAASFPPPSRSHPDASSSDSTSLPPAQISTDGRSPRPSATSASHKGSHHTLYAYRFLIGAAVFLSNVANSAVWATYASVTPSTASYFGAAPWQINLLSIIFAAAFIVVPWVLDVYGLRPATLFGAWATVLGALIRYLSNLAPTWTRLGILSLGQMIAALGQPFLLETPTKAAANWFGERERLTANTVMSLGQPIGTALILALAPAIVSEDPSNVATLNLATFLLALVCAIPSLFARNRPPTPPSRSAESVSLPFLDGARALVKNGAFWVVWVVFGLLIGAFNVFVTLIADYVTPQGYSESDAGNVGLVSIVVGLVAAGVVGPILDRTKAHRTVFRFLPMATAFGGILFFLGAGWSGRLILLYVAAVFIGIGGFPMMPLSLELGVECTYPVAEGTSAGLLWTAGQVFGTVGILVSNGLRAADPSMRPATGLLLLMLVGAMAVAPFYAARSRRMALEAREAGDDGESIRVGEGVVEAVRDVEAGVANAAGKSGATVVVKEAVVVDDEGKANA